MFATYQALLATVGGLLVGGISLAGAAGSKTLAAQQPSSITGCLAKGADKDSYTIKGSDGTTHTLTSSSVKLEEHVGHTVTVTGTASGMETGAMKDTAAHKDTTGGMAGMPAGPLKVTSLKMVSAQCK
jgi:hypothetical protein